MLKIKKKYIYYLHGRIIEVQGKNDVSNVAKKVSKQIDSLIEKGVKSNNISGIGASKGAIISSYVAIFNKNI